MAEKQKNTDAFGVILRKYRHEKGLTQEQLSERVDVVRSYICTLEKGDRQPSLQMILRLADALGVRPGDMINDMVDRLAEK